jgi:diketogulonate reductase-like aldo/keto reductase
LELDLLNDSVIVTIAAEHEITPAQTVLAWHLRLGALPIPKSKSTERMRENFNVFDVALTNNDIASIATLARADGRLADQDPATYQEF